MKRQVAIKDPYSLRIRYLKKDGQWTEWDKKGTGEFTDLATAQKSIRVLISSSLNRKFEIEFMHQKQLKDYNGVVTNKAIRYGFPEI